MSKPVLTDEVGIEFAKALGLSIEGLTGLEIKLKAGCFITLVADYEAGEEAFSKFCKLVSKYEAKEDSDAVENDAVQP